MDEVAHNIKWKPISLFYVEYPEGEKMFKFNFFFFYRFSFHSGDPLGFMLAWISFVPILIIVGFIALLIMRRDLHTVSYFIFIWFFIVFSHFS